MKELLVRVNLERPVMGFISFSDDIAVSADDDEANELWDETSERLKEIGLEIDQSKS